MTGINNTNIEELIKKNNYYLESLEDNLKKLSNVVKDISSYYEGKCLSYLFSLPITQITKSSIIPSVVQSYSSVLSDVKTSYEQQQLNISTQIKNMQS